ncbi:MAG TPA: hypothetical protein VKB57_00440 [Acidimicrobiales bacterium]|nr:hypothetical protein [Acidimicrobiales bacterium]
MTTASETGEVADDPDDPPLRPRRPVVPALAAYLPAALIAAGGWAHRFTSEDACINFRVLDNLFAGNGPVFNAGERIEAGTSPLWIAVLGVGRLLFGWFLSIEWIAVGLCLVAAVAAFALAGRCARQMAPGPDAVAVPLGLVAVASVAVTWDYATSGLEMSLVWLWIAGCWWILCRAARGAPASGARRVAAGAVIGLAPLLRPDLGLMMVCITVAWFAVVRPRRVAADLAAMFALPLAYQVFRMGYYASLVPSTALAKDAGSPHVHQGWAYLADLAGPYRLWLPVALMAVTIVLRLRAEGDRRARTVTLAMVAAALLHAGYIVAVGGDYMHGRLLLPAFFALGLPAVAVVRRHAISSVAAERRLPVPSVAAERRLPVPTLALCALAAVWAVAAVTSFRPPVPAPGLAQIADWRVLVGARVTPAEVELWPTGIPADQIYDRGVRGYIRVLAAEPVPGRDPHALVVALGSIGVPAYQLGTDVWVVDIGGLAEPLAARTDPVPGRPAGHRKQVDPAWYDARFGVVGDDPAARDAARALRCGPVRDLLAAVDGPLTPGRFLSNIWHSPGYTRLEIPADPHEAVARFCPR